MKIKLIFISMLIITQFVEGQKYISKNGHIWFYSHTPIEDIEAHNRQVVSILDVSTGNIALELLIKSFEFPKALMQEHFNENYLESDKIPKASFKGKITNLDKIDFTKDGSYPAMVSGELSIHGVTKTITANGMILVQNGSVSATAKFIVSPKDYNIDIPAVVEDHIAKEIEVNVDIPYATN